MKTDRGLWKINYLIIIFFFWYLIIIFFFGASLFAQEKPQK